MLRYRIWIFLLFAVTLLFAPLGYAQQPASASLAKPEALTNSDVMKMVEAKLGDDLIISKIQASACSFDTSTDTILKLKSQGVSDGVIQAMVSAGKPPNQASTPAAAPVDPNNPLSPHTPGIYWLARNQGGQQLTRLEASSYGGSRSSIGFGKVKYKAALARPHAALRIHEPSPEFWFYFEDAAQGFGRPLSPQSSKPEDFVLAKMEGHEKERQLFVGQASGFGGSSGPRSKDAVAVDIQRIAPGIFKVRVSKALEPGEYCFVPPGGAAGFGIAGGQLFDFGVDRPQ
ncbi:MAG TPA: hypothetical protein VHF01_16235 [Candidatus Acidoferrum sp.]|nr:hypothetical protein [Candidatus Acidoferrum sp.]